MKYKNIIARVDGSASIGYGHVYRMLAMCQIFQDQTSVSFVSKDDIRDIIPANYSFHQLAEDDLAFFSSIDPSQNVLFLDGYAFDEQYQTQIRMLGFKLVYIDDLVFGIQQANVLINPSIGVAEEHYQTVSNVRFGLGPKYSLLRSSFLNEAAKRNTASVAEMKKAFVAFGGADPLNLAERFISILSSFDLDEINVLSSRLDANLISDPRVKIHEGLDEIQMLQLMDANDLAIVSSSTICYEIGCLRIPMLCGMYVDNQKDLYAGIIAQKLSSGLGDLREETDEQIKECITNFLKADHSEQLKAQIEWFDGKNAERIKDLIAPLLKLVEVRNASIDDAELVFEWMNDPEVRKQSINTSDIKLEDHLQWFSHKMNDKSSTYYMGHINGELMGQIRFDNKEDHLLLSYLISKENRGKGLGFDLVKRGVDTLRAKGESMKILAQVKPDNKASQKVFERLGFVKLEGANSDLIDYWLK